MIFGERDEERKISYVVPKNRTICNYFYFNGDHLSPLVFGGMVWSE